MKKINLRLLLGLGGASLLTSTCAPLIVSCANNSSNNGFSIDTQNKQANFNAQKNKNINIFTFFKNLSTDTKFQEQVKNTFTTQSHYDFNNLVLDVNNLKIDLQNFDLIIPVLGINPTPQNTNNIDNSNDSEPNLPIPDVQRIVLKFDSYNKVSLENSINKNTYYLKQQNLPLQGKTAQDIANLTLNEIQQVTNALVPAESIFLPNPDLNPKTPLYTEIFVNNQGNEVVRFLAINDNGLSQVLITTESINVSTVDSSYMIKQTFGDTVTNQWNSIVNDIKISLPSKWVFDSTNTISAPIEGGTQMYGYSDFINKISSLAPQTTVDKINSYLQLPQDNTTKEFNDLSPSFIDDLKLFLKQYINDVNLSWETRNLISSGVFVASNLKINPDQTISGQLGIQLKNDSALGEVLTLPLSHDNISVKPYEIVTLLIDFKESSFKPSLVVKNIKNNEAYLSSSFNNLSLNVYRQKINENPTDESDLSQPTYSFISNDYSDLFKNSITFKTLVTNVKFAASINDINTAITQAKKEVTANDLKDLKQNQINQLVNNIKTVVTSVEDIMLKIAKDVPIFELLQNISKPMNDILMLITGDANISGIISDLFTTDKTSTYLYKNISRIIGLLKSVDNGSSPQLTAIISLLEDISINYVTQEQLQTWVKQIEGLFPTLEKLLSSGISWIMPLIKDVMTGISQDTSIIDFLFSNIENILTFLEEPDKEINLGAQTQQMIKAIHGYLNNIVLYANANQIDITNAEKFKTFTTLDILAFELNNSDASKSLLSVIGSILSAGSPSLANTLNTIAGILAQNLEVPNELKDYSSSTWNNKTYAIGGGLNEYVPSEPTIINLKAQLQKVVETIFIVQVGSQQQSLSSILETNLVVETSSDTFSYDTKNQSVTQNLTIKLSFKDTIKWDLMPILVLLDNTKIIIPRSLLNSLGISNFMIGLINTLIGIGGQKVVEYQNPSDQTNSDVYTTFLSKLLPTDLVINNTNSVILSYSTANAPILPTISNNGHINWMYNALENIGIEGSQILKDSNQRFRVQNDNKTKQYYGARFGLLSNISELLKIIKQIFKADVYIAFDGGITNFVSITTNLSNPPIISNYSSNIYDPNALITELKPRMEFEQYLNNVINNYGQWINDTQTNKPAFSLKENYINTLKEELKQYFDISKDVNYTLGFSGVYYSLGSTTYSYNLVICLDRPVLFKDINGVSQLTQALYFPITSNTAPTPTPPPQAPAR